MFSITLMWCLHLFFVGVSCDQGSSCDKEDVSALAVNLRPEDEFSSRERKLINCAKAPPGTTKCFDTMPPKKFTVRFFLADGHSFRVRVFRDWAPVFAQRFWQTSKLGWWRNISIYRNVYVNSSFRFVSQFGLSGIPAVDAAWTKWKTSNATAPALKSNLRGTVSFSMGAVLCKDGNDPNPCAALRPNCTANDYCALGFTTEIFVNYKDNSHLDSHGFAPFGKVLETDLKELENSKETGMKTMDFVGERLGRKYGEVTELCPEKQSADTTPFCVYKNGKRAGVNVTTLQEQGNLYIAADFPEMYSLRISDSSVS